MGKSRPADMARSHLVLILNGDDFLSFFYFSVLFQVKTIKKSIFTIICDFCICLFFQWLEISRVLLHCKDKKRRNVAQEHSASKNVKLANSMRLT